MKVDAFVIFLAGFDVNAIRDGPRMFREGSANVKPRFRDVARQLRDSCAKLFVQFWCVFARGSLWFWQFD